MTEARLPRSRRWHPVYRYESQPAPQELGGVEGAWEQLWPDLFEAERQRLHTPAEISMALVESAMSPDGARNLLAQSRQRKREDAIKRKQAIAKALSSSASLPKVRTAPPHVGRCDHDHEFCECLVRDPRTRPPPAWTLMKLPPPPPTRADVARLLRTASRQQHRRSRIRRHDSKRASTVPTSKRKELKQCRQKQEDDEQEDTLKDALKDTKQQTRGAGGRVEAEPATTPLFNQRAVQGYWNDWGGYDTWEGHGSPLSGVRGRVEWITAGAGEGRGGQNGVEEAGAAQRACAHGQGQRAGVVADPANGLLGCECYVCRLQEQHGRARTGGSGRDRDGAGDQAEAEKKGKEDGRSTLGAEQDEGLNSGARRQQQPGVEKQAAGVSGEGDHDNNNDGEGKKTGGGGDLEAYRCPLSAPLAAGGSLLGADIEMLALRISRERAVYTPGGGILGGGGGGGSGSRSSSTSRSRRSRAAATAGSLMLASRERPLQPLHLHQQGMNYQHHQHQHQHQHHRLSTGSSVLGGATTGSLPSARPWSRATEVSVG